MNHIFKTISLLFGSILGYILDKFRVVLDIIRHILLLKIPTDVISLIFIFIGSLIAVCGILFTDSLGIINSSIIGNSDPGLIVFFLNPSGIKELIHNMNKSLLTILLLSLGYGLACLSRLKDHISCKYVLFGIILLLLIIIAIPGYTRIHTIERWQDKRCNIQWIIKLLNKGPFEEMHNKFAKTGETQESLKNMIKYFSHISDALDIETKIVIIDKSEPSLEEIDNLRSAIKEDVDNKSLFYFINLKKLIMAYK
jgi:hypothetical protein